MVTIVEIVMRSNILVTITGPSCAGKTTFANSLLETETYEYVPTYTTREPREGEDESNYIFMTEEGFDEGKDEGIFAECNYYSGNWYGTTIDSLKDIWNENKVAVKVLEPNGIYNLESLVDKLNFKIVKVWIGGRPEILAERLRARSDQRNTEHEMSWYKRLKWNYVIKELYDFNREFHVGNLTRLLPTLVRHTGMRVWGSS